jgi:hypothetical protein
MEILFVNIQNIFKLAAAGLGSIGIVLTVFENYRHFSIVLEENYWTMLTIAWILSAASVWPGPERKTVIGPQATYRVSRLKKGLRYKWVFLITVLFLAVGYYRHYIISTPTPGNRPILEPGGIPLPLGFYTSVVFKHSSSEGPKLLQFSLMSEKTLYTQILTTYKLPYGVVDRLYAGMCADDFDVAASLQALRNYAKNSGKGKLLKYIDNEKQLKDLIKEHPNEAKELLPSKSEWQRFERLDYNAILSWVRNCVGIFFPVFLITIENSADQSILVTKVIYNVYKIETGRGQERTGPLIPTASYAHRIKIHKGAQQFSLTPGFNIPAKQNGSFEIQLWTDAIETSVDLDMDVEFTTNKGSVKTSRFHLVFEVVSR